MKNLVTDTSSSVCSVGLFEDDKLIVKNELDNANQEEWKFFERGYELALKNKWGKGHLCYNRGDLILYKRGLFNEK